VPFRNQTTLTVTAAMHGFDSPHLPANAIAPSEVTINSDTFEVKITFSINVTIPMTVPPGNAEAPHPRA